MTVKPTPSERRPEVVNALNSLWEEQVAKLGPVPAEDTDEIVRQLEQLEGALYGITRGDTLRSMTLAALLVRIKTDELSAAVAVDEAMDPEGGS